VTFRDACGEVLTALSDAEGSELEPLPDDEQSLWTVVARQAFFRSTDHSFSCVLRHRKRHWAEPCSPFSDDGGRRSLPPREAA